MPGLAERRAQRGYTQEQMATVAGISRPAYSHIEVGRKRPSLPVALRIASALDATVEDLFGSMAELPADEEAADV
jgi:DNA-binding XRE family transcriptional regulator